MATVLQNPATLEDELKTAAQGVHFGIAETLDEREPGDTPVTSAQRSFSRTLSRNGWLWSVVLHGLAFLLLAGMAGVVARHELVPEFDAIRASLSDREVFDDEALIPEGVEIILQQSSGPAARKTSLPSSVTEITSEEADHRWDPADFAPAIGADGDQDQGVGSGGTEGFRYQKPKGGQAVTKGSFTVWTEPPDPLPNQPYLIVVQLRVPEKLTVYPKADLCVEVQGSDTFYLRLPDPRRGFNLLGSLPVIEGQAQLVIPIPGAPSLVSDVIQIESREILKEKQTLQIRF